MSDYLFRNLEPDAEGRVKQSIFAVEATSAEYSFLWANHASESSSRQFDPVDWREVGMGFGVTVGTLKKMPVVISLRWAFLDGQLVMFWHATSQVVDHRQIDNWMEKHFTAKWDGTRRATCDASNFHHCIGAVREANAAKLVRLHGSGKLMLYASGEIAR